MDIDSKTNKKVLFCTGIFREDVNSAGRHMIDLVKQFHDDGYYCTVVCNAGKNDLEFAETKNLNFNYRGLPYSLRLIAEIVTPLLAYLRYFILSKENKYDHCIVYSPSIFWYILVNLISKDISGKKILIIRDLFPLWLSEVGLLKSQSSAFKFLNKICERQLNAFDVVLTQHAADIEILRSQYNFQASVGVLPNWYSPSPTRAISSKIMEFSDTEHHVMAVVGNFGIAQNYKKAASVMHILLSENPDLKIIFIGQSEETTAYFQNSFDLHNERIYFQKYLPHDDVMNVLAKVDFGFFSLDFNNTHAHFPGKVVAYLMAGLPVFGMTARGSTIQHILEENNLGLVINDEADINRGFKKFRENNWSRKIIKNYSLENLSTNKASQIVRKEMEK